MTRRIAMNLLWCVPGVGGSEEYLVRQLLGLAEIAEGDRDARATDFVVDVFAPRGFARRRPDVAERFRIVEAPSSCERRPERVALEYTWLAHHTRSHHLVHHGVGSVPRRIGISRVKQATLLTIHDIQWTDYPEYVRPVKLRYLQYVVPSSLRRATHIAVPSQFVADTLQQHFDVAPERIGVVRHGLERQLTHHVTAEHELRRRFGLGNGPVLVYPAITHPHKNHSFILSLLHQGEGLWGDPDLRVVFAGSSGLADNAVRAQVATLNLADRVVMPGRVNDADRNGLLAMATAMIFPSQYEGFGAPLIEAMAMGSPVLCSDRASIPSVVGDAAVVAPLREAAWVDGLARVVADRDMYVARGRGRAQEFTAVASARDLVVQYDIALARVSGERSRNNQSRRNPS